MILKKYNILNEMLDDDISLYKSFVANRLPKLEIFFLKCSSMFLTFSIFH